MAAITAEEFARLAGFIRQKYGIHLKEEKKALLTGRLRQELERHRLATFSEYYQLVSDNPDGKIATELVNRITTNHTYFMREPEHFHFLVERVLPELALYVKDKDLRLWCAGCSTGEEAYTLAMLLQDYFKRLGGWDTRVMATDISNQALDAAVRGEYPDPHMASVTNEWKKTYFCRTPKGDWMVKDELKAQVLFRRLNLMDEAFPFRKKLHVIFCRNVMIYFDAPTKQRLVDKFVELLEPGGYLFIGHSESLVRDRTALRYIQPAVYRKE